LQKFSQSDFEKAGYGNDFFTQLQFIVEDEQSHVIALTAAIQGAGQAPVCACTYNFNMNDV
jgi:Ferritin-like domain